MEYTIDNDLISIEPIECNNRQIRLKKRLKSAKIEYFVQSYLEFTL